MTLQTIIEGEMEHYSVPQLAKITNESLAAWRKRILLKQIAYIKCGRNVRVSRSALQNWLAARTVSC
jgi:hypothetical protein